MPLRVAEKMTVIDMPQVTTATLPVPAYTQQQSMWCWAACIEMVLTYYNTAAVQQCEIVNYGVQRTDCCSNPSSGWCNTSISTAMYAGIYNHFGVNNFAPLGGPATFVGVQQNINHNRVLEAQLNWAVGGAHVVLVIGWLVADDNSIWVLVNDPGFAGSFWSTYANLMAAYGQGYWYTTWSVWE
ncbi:hypothetical protein COCOR_06888 [Corallococcus coralloides DSM 2259]|uniref:Peptidase C39-like domain-containing protein n=1 Tax=Corallococcus coralloides (strain ATCC 25202 / DSM 2259 / NBRC 100086 / M2) TaxID=1144275 RepID=H8N132_CORCM|nr:papain-like cysteine protease family protein [Corallococcus coralloides]AFE07198.1 hypothetical protein COCOR_06888 [Corallococcus coralloides DSM 2259]